MYSQFTIKPKTKKEIKKISQICKVFDIKFNEEKIKEVNDDCITLKEMNSVFNCFDDHDKETIENLENNNFRGIILSNDKYHSKKLALMSVIIKELFPLLILVESKKESNIYFDLLKNKNIKEEEICNLYENNEILSDKKVYIIKEKDIYKYNLFFTIRFKSAILNGLYSKKNDRTLSNKYIYYNSNGINILFKEVLSIIMVSKYDCTKYYKVTKNISVIETLVEKSLAPFSRLKNENNVTTWTYSMSLLSSICSLQPIHSSLVSIFDSKSNFFKYLNENKMASKDLVNYMKLGGLCINIKKDNISEKTKK